jgi:rubrerythrin
MALVVFRSKAAGEIFMFAETARRILSILGKEDAPRGVISADQLAEAISRLTAAIDEEKAQLKRAREAAEQAERRGEPAAEDAARAITLAQRAHPLLEMLRAAQKKRVDVTWGV